MACVTEELSFNLILINSNLNSYMWLMAALLDSADTDQWQILSHIFL